MCVWPFFKVLSELQQVGDVKYYPGNGAIDLQKLDNGWFINVFVKKVKVSKHVYSGNKDVLKGES